MPISLRKIKDLTKDNKYMLSFAASFALLLFSLVVNYYAASYALAHESNPVADIILSNIPTYNVDLIFSYGPFVFWAVIAIICLYNPKKIPLTLKSIAVFVLIRSAFISMTHIGPSPDMLHLESFDWNFLKTLTDSTNFFVFTSGGDLFFSAHTGLPFLMALVYWKDSRIRIFCILSSIMFGIVVLMGHLHYTIDVASAFFITYAIYHLVIWMFPRDYQRFVEN